MSDLKPTPIKVKLGDKEYGLLFDINAIDMIQDHFDIPISKITDLMKDERKVFKVIRYFLTVLINEAIDDAENGEKHVDEQFIGRKLSPANMDTLKTAILKAFTNGTPKSDDDDESPNAMSE